MDTNKKTSWLDRLIERHGEKLFLERVKNNPKYYRLSHDNHNEVNNLIEATKRKNINIIKGYNIPIKYEGKYANDYRDDNNKLSEKENKFKLGVTDDDENIQPKITLLKPVASAPRIAMLETIGHEIGHAKDRLKLKPKMQKIENLRNRGNNKKANKKYEQLSEWYNKRDDEAIADKIFPNTLNRWGFLKKIGKHLIICVENISKIIDIEANMAILNILKIIYLVLVYYLKAIIYINRYRLSGKT